MKTILYYEASSGYGGSSSNLNHILRQLDTTHFKPIVVTHADGIQFSRMREAGIQVVQIPTHSLEDVHHAGGLRLLALFLIRILPLVWKLRRFILQNQIDIIHINTNILLGIPAILAAQSANKPVFCYLRESRPLIKRERLFVRLVDRFFALSHRAFDLYSRDIPKQKLTVLYDGIDLDAFADVDPANFINEFHLDGKPLIGLVGRILPGKGQLEFVQAAHRVLMHLPEARFVIVGDPRAGNPEYSQQVVDLIREKNLTKQILLTGWRNDVKEITAAMDVLVLASTNFPEGMPNAIIEAMALRKPVVATDIPGPTEVVADQETGYIVPPGDIQAMADRIVLLLADPEKAQAMGAAGRKRVEQLFNVRDVARTLEQIYNDTPSRS